MPSASRISRIASETSCVLAGDKPRRLFNHRDFRAQPSKHLRELEPDVASAHDDEALRQGVEFEQRRVGESLDLVDPGEVWLHGATTNIDEEAFRLEHVVANGDRRGREEARVASDDRAIRHAFAASP